MLLSLANQFNFMLFVYEFVYKLRAMLSSFSFFFFQYPNRLTGLKAPENSSPGGKISRWGDPHCGYF